MDQELERAPVKAPELGQVKALASGPEPELGLDLVLALGWVPGLAQAKEPASG